MDILHAHLSITQLFYATQYLAMLPIYSEWSAKRTKSALAN